MVYVLYWHDFSLPGATTNQFLFGKYDSKQKFLEALIRILDENRETICDLDGEYEGASPNRK